MYSLSFSLHAPSLQPLSTSKPSSSSPSFLHTPILFRPALSSKFTNLHRCRRLIPLSINLTAGNPDDPLKKINLDRVLHHARDMFDNLPQPVKIFPWAKTLESFIDIVLDLSFAVVKWLFIPVLAVSSLSEMSYCAHESKMGVIPVSFLVGFALAGVFKEIAIKLEPDMKEAGFPWHLLLNVVFFTLLKMPGPYYPYWGRFVIPHFANGGLWRSVWLAFMWYRGDKTSPTISIKDCPTTVIIGNMI